MIFSTSVIHVKYYKMGASNSRISYDIDTDKLNADNITTTIHLYAPISGYITLVNAVQGQFAEPTDVIFEIINTDHLHVKLKVYETEILQIRIGDKINFQIPESTNQMYSGVQKISQIKLTLPNSGGNFISLNSFVEIS